MKIVLFQFYSPNAMPDYDEIGMYLSNYGHDTLVTHMTGDKQLKITNNGRDYFRNIFPYNIGGKVKIAFFRRRIVNIVFMFKIRKWIKEVNPDVYILNPAELMYLFLLPLFMPRNIKFILDIRQLGFFPGNNLVTKIKNTRAKWRFIFLQKFIFDHTCFASEEAVEFIFGKIGIKNVSVKRVGVNQKFFDVVIPPKKTDNILKLVYIGSIARVRQLEFIIDSLKELSKKTNQFHLTFVGPSVDNYYSEYIDSLGLSNLISISDPVPYIKVPEILHQYDVAIAYVPDHPDWKYQPTLKILEYSAAGIPIIASDNIPNRKIIKENITGCFFKTRISSFKIIVLKLIEDKKLLNTLTQEAASNRVGLTWEDSAVNYENLILSL
jgi:glycosyltransferase involved in cell wall biosynthesis